MSQVIFGFFLTSVSQVFGIICISGGYQDLLPGLYQVFTLIEDACGESPAASYFGLLSLGDVQIMRSLFVHYSLFICDHSLIMQTKPSKSDVPVSWRDFGVSWEHLGGS